MPSSSPDDRHRPAPPRLGPYETAYDVRRGYERPPARRIRPADEDLLLFRPRDPEPTADAPSGS